MPNRSMRAKTYTRHPNLANQNHSLQPSEERQRLEQSKLMEVAESVCSDLNSRAGELIVESQSYLPPQEILRSFVFVNGNADYVMQIELRMSGPIVTFFARRWRDSSRNPCVRLLYRLGALEAVSMRFKFACSVDEGRVTKAEIEKWFRYLLSGLRHKFRPDKLSGLGTGLNAFDLDSRRTDLAVGKTNVARS
jgi:hypothetical protein